MGQRLDLVVGGPAHDVVGRDLVGVAYACGLHHFQQGMQRLLVEVVHPVGLVGNDQRLLAQGVLRGYAGGALARVAVLGLNAA